MKTIIACFLLFLVVAAVPFDIISRPIQTIYDEYGGSNQFKISFKPTANVFTHSMLQITFSQIIHLPSTSLTYTLQNQNEMTLIQSSLSLVPTSSIYYFPINQSLIANDWYIIWIVPQIDPTLTYGLIGISVISGVTTSAIIYQSNNAFQYYHLQAITLPPQNIAFTSLATPSTNAASIYSYKIAFTSSYTTSSSISISFVFTNQNYSLLSPSTPLIQNNNFKFIGSCQIICSNVSCIHPLSCSVTDNKAKLSLPYLDSSQYTIQFTIANPNFVDGTGMAAQIYNQNGVIAGMTIANNLLSVSAISILPAGVNLHWGIPLSIVTSQMGLGLFVDGGWNSIDIGFTLSDFTVIGGQFILVLQVGAYQVLQHSINTNLPNLNGTSPLRCIYESLSIICSPIDAFTSTTIRYFIKFKAFILSTDNIASLGSISINLVQNSQALFTPLIQNLAIPTVQWTDYHDYSGFHASNLKIGETQIVGTADSALANATSTYMNNLLNNPAFIGIDPSITNQQLIFLTKTASSQMSISGLANQTYEMKIYINHKVFKQISKKGIDVAAYSQSTNSYRQDAISCYINSSTSPTIQIYQCQAYNDYVYGRQLDNTYVQTSNYGLYRFFCGNGTVVVCPNTTVCAESCRLFKGKGSLNGDSGIFSIRNVTFQDGYQSSVETNDMVLDFIIAFYHGGTLVSASLLNAYTIKSTRLGQLGPQIYNNYLSSTKNNDGNRLPTLLSVRGHLTIQQINGFKYDKFMLFLPTQTSVNKYIQNSGRLGCTHSCLSYRNNPTSFACKDNWLCKQAVLVSNINNIDTNIDIKFPIQILTTIMGSIDIALISNNKIIIIYRFNGSAIQDSLTPAQLPISQVSVYSNNWTNPNYWVNTFSDVYNQGINLNLISPFSNFNTIDMLGSVLTIQGSPYLTFTSIHQSIFSQFTYAIANNKDRCNKPFTYVYNKLFNVNVLWCPLTSNALNQINISYPLYPNNLGANFPFQTLFTYGISDERGNLQSFRQQTNIKTIKQICTTSLTTVYNYAEITQQLISSTLTIAPIVLSNIGYTSIQFAFNTPITIPLLHHSCSVTQIIVNQIFSCSIVYTTTNKGIIQIDYLSAGQITITSLQILLWVSSAGLASVSTSTSYTYSFDVILPQTDSLGVSPLNYGSAYAPYSSLVSSCSSIMNLVSIFAVNQVIILSNILVHGVALNYLADITFDVQFSTSRINLLSSSKITIQFTGAITTALTTCSLWKPEIQLFLQQTLTISSVLLSSFDNIISFSSNLYNILCRNLIIQSNSIKIKILWNDGANILQQSSLIPYTTYYPVSTSVTGTLISKNYNSEGYDSEFHIIISLSTITGDSVQIWLDINTYHTHSFALQCHYLSNGVKSQVYCVQDWKGKIHIILQSCTSTALQLWIYGIKQDQSTSLPFQTLVSLNNLLFYRISITDAFSPSIIAGQPIVIKNQSIDVNCCINLIFSFPITYSSQFYLQLDDYFMINYPQIITCYLDTVTIPCLRNAPNLIKIFSTTTLLLNTDHALIICPAIPTNLDQNDPQFIHFKLFTLAGSTVSMGSHQHVNYPLQIASIPAFPLNLLMWSQPFLNISWVYHKIFVGYYSRSISLSTTNISNFLQNVPISYSSLGLIAYINTETVVKMGTSFLVIDLAATSRTDGSKLDYLVMNHNSTLYAPIPFLPIFISNQKCSISLQYIGTYDLYPSGITIPILFDFSNCRPTVQHSLNYSINSPDLIIDGSLTNFKVNATQYKVFVVIRQAPTNNLLSGIFTLQTLLLGPYNTSYFALPSVLIKVIPGTILQIPQSLQPVVNEQNNSFINLTVQCNQASTIYWALGLYPTILGITASQIQAQLINGQEGLRNRVIDPYSWSQQLYGFEYDPNPNKNKNIIINSLRGSRNYIFKYFCVNQLGFESGGKILTFNTFISLFQLVKVTIAYSSKLNIQQSNLISCFLSEIIVNPYSTTTTSTFSNCYNSSQIFFPNPNITYFDQSSNSLYYYHFYIDSLITPTSLIRSTLPNIIPTYLPYVSSMPPYSSININTLINNYDPLVVHKYFEITANKIKCTIDVGVANSYLIAAYMEFNFDPITMTIPPHYLIKQGNFSAATQFNQVFMKYGSNNISIDLQGLKQYQNYSIFYFVTVDNPALNSKPTQVYYQNMQTNVLMFYDLWQKYIAIIMLLFMIASI